MTTIQWHRPSERMPDDDMRVLVTLRSEDGGIDTDIGWHADTQWFDATAWPISDADVVAWAELPECPL